MGQWSDKTRHPHAWATDPYIAAVAKDSGWIGLTGDLSLFEAIVATESEGDPSKVSESGCASLPQFHPQQQQMFDTDKKWGPQIQASLAAADALRPAEERGQYSLKPRAFASNHRLTKQEKKQRREEWTRDPAPSVIYSGYALLDHSTGNLVLTLQGYNGGGVYAHIHNPDKSTRMGKDASEYPGKIAAYLYYHVLHDVDPTPYANTLSQLLNDAAKIGAYGRVYNDMIRFSETGSMEANREIQWAALDGGKGAPPKLETPRTASDHLVQETVKVSTHIGHKATYRADLDYDNFKFHHAPSPEPEPTVVVVHGRRRDHTTDGVSPSTAEQPPAKPVVAEAAHPPTKPTFYGGRGAGQLTASTQDHPTQTGRGYQKPTVTAQPAAPAPHVTAPAPTVAPADVARADTLAKLAQALDQHYRGGESDIGVNWAITHGGSRVVFTGIQQQLNTDLDSSDIVKAIQKQLGFTGGDVDGKFGTKTLAAFKQWEQAHSPTTADGLVSAAEVKMLIDPDLPKPAPTPAVAKPKPRDSGPMFMGNV